MRERNENLRIATVVRGEKIRLIVDGNVVDAYEGETVHAALTAAKIRKIEHSNSDHARGVFCGMGICYGCLVTIDNVPEQRACMTLVKDQMEIRTDEN